MTTEIHCNDFKISTSSPFKLTCSIGIQCFRHSHYIFRSNKLLPQLIVFSRSIRSYRQRFMRIISPTQGVLRISYTMQVPRLVSGWLRPWSRGDIAINIQFKGYFRKTLHDCLFWQWLSQASGDTALGIAKNCKIIRQFTAPLKQ